MRAFTEAWNEATMVQQVAAPLSWSHHQCLLDRVKDADARAAFEHGWSRNVLTHQIETRLIERQGQALTNFDRTLPPAQSDLAQQTFKDPYVVEFLDLEPGMQERALERSYWNSSGISFLNSVKDSRLSQASTALK